MNIRHLATKNFDDPVRHNKAVVYDGVPIVIRSQKTDIISFDKPSGRNVKVYENVESAKLELMDSPIGDILFWGSDVVSLSQLYDFRVETGGILSDVLPVGAGFHDIFEDETTKEYMRGIAVDMFPKVNPNTGRCDVDENSFYAPYVPLVVLSGSIPVQTKDGEAYFNSDGVVSIAEFLDCLNAIKYGSNANNSRKRTLDNISDVDDYFNEGYQRCLEGMSSPFFNLYTRRELMEPITRLELAYITVVCWSQFVEKFSGLYGSRFYLGINFDWLNASDILSQYTDGLYYKVSKVSISYNDMDTVSLNIRDYKKDYSMTEYKNGMKSGRYIIPMPMFMSLVELGVADLFYFENNRLDPVKEVSRGELCYFLARLAKLFPTMYITNKEGK